MKTTSLVLTGALLFLVCVRARAQQQTRNPHGKLAEECAVCHSAEAWVPARVSTRFDHGRRGFTLAGAHVQAACRSCHVSLDFRGASRDCASCHRDVHRGELGADCARCHTARSFIDRSGMARAHQLTRFPLTGAHLALDCDACHTPSPQGQLTFVNVSAQCVSCHLPQFQATTNPSHVTGRFPQDCGQCHLPTIWSSARFNHDATGFPLTGAHRAAQCTQCHAGGVFAAMSTACTSCHQPDYVRTTSPPHSSSGYPTTCETCHTTSGWTGASFNHTWFPVPHRNATQCRDCHTNPSAYSTFVCTTCHTQGQTDPHHRSVRGYTWTSSGCYACHRNGRS